MELIELYFIFRLFFLLKGIIIIKDFFSNKGRHSGGCGGIGQHQHVSEDCRGQDCGAAARVQSELFFPFKKLNVVKKIDLQSLFCFIYIKFYYLLLSFPPLTSREGFSSIGINLFIR